MRFEARGDNVLVRFTKEKLIDQDEIKAIGRALIATLDSPKDKRFRIVELDLAAVQFISSGGISELLAIAKDVHKRGGRTRMRGLRAPLVEALRLINLGSHFGLDEGSDFDDPSDPFDGGSPVPKPPASPLDNLSAARKFDSESD